VNAAANAAGAGYSYPGHNPVTFELFPIPVSVVVKIDGGPAKSFMVYSSPLNPVVNMTIPIWAVISTSSDNVDGALHGGQVIIDGSTFPAKYRGCPGISTNFASNVSIWGTGQGTMNAWPNASGQAEPGLAIVNCVVGVYSGDFNYHWITESLITHCGIGVLVASQTDVPPNTIINGVPFNPGPPPSNPWAGGGLVISTSWITDSTDMNFRANCWSAGPMAGWPAIGHTIISCLDNPGSIDGIVYNNSRLPTSTPFSGPVRVGQDIIGPGLRNGVVNNQNGLNMLSFSDLFINPSQYDIVKLNNSQNTTNTAYAIQVAAVATPLNANNQAHTAF
jgi:hypothetical protein